MKPKMIFKLSIDLAMTLLLLVQMAFIEENIKLVQEKKKLRLLTSSEKRDADRWLNEIGTEPIGFKKSLSKMFFF
jgi:hypothetical protein